MGQSEETHSVRAQTPLAEWVSSSTQPFAAPESSPVSVTSCMMLSRAPGASSGVAPCGSVEGCSHGPTTALSRLIIGQFDMVRRFPPVMHRSCRCAAGWNCSNDQSVANGARVRRRPLHLRTRKGDRSHASSLATWRRTKACTGTTAPPLALRTARKDTHP